jgi:signal transduction histidine kinase
MDEQEAPQNEGSPELFMFLASTVHDMKNSISVLSGTLENLLAAHPSNSAPEYGQMAHMLYQTKRLNDNLIQLLALYKDVGKPGYPFEPPQRARTGEQVASQARMLLQSRGIARIDYPQHAIWTLDEDLVIGCWSMPSTTPSATRATACAWPSASTAITSNCGWKTTAAASRRAAGGGRQRHGPQRARIDFLSNSSGLGLYFSSEVAKMHKHRQRSGSIALENGGTLGGGCFILRLP